MFATTTMLPLKAAPPAVAERIKRLLSLPPVVAEVVLPAVTVAAPVPVVLA